MLLTKYIENFDSNNPLNEYPRPQLVRDSYMNLNGSWYFTISKEKEIPEVFDMTITVPYCVESCLSGICKKVEKDDILYYKKIVNFPKKFIKDKVLLHFDAIDQFACIYVNGTLVAKSINGYLPVVIDIKPYLKEADNEIIVQAIDTLDLNYPYGKQREDRGGMWYTPVSGIWQSVWIESVDEDYVSLLTITPDIDNNKVGIVVNTTSDVVSIQVYEQDKLIYKEKTNKTIFDINIENPHLWSPEDPFLYNVIIKTKNDEVKSYFAMRKFSFDNEKFLLNNKPYFIHGLLDQGYFSDGIYTPASYQAYKDDILSMKELGFNTLRKHIKIEPMIFYHYCDKYGMIVFQDMVNNGKYSFAIDTAFPTIFRSNNTFINSLKKVSQLQKDIFNKSLIDTLNYLYNVPSICYYTIFNEGWGQHDADDYYDLLKSIDNTRVVDSTSGWFKEIKSDVESLHVYFRKIKFKHKDKPLIVSEFGGYAYKVENHVFNETKDYGYKKFNTLESFNDALFKLYERDVVNNIKHKLAGCIYTQVSDVEDEINGLLTYDRKVLKVNKEKMLKIKEMIDKEFYNE